MGGNDERENIGSVLTRDGWFWFYSGVIILAATNRADVLDKTPFACNRFDRQIHVDLPMCTSVKRFSKYIYAIKTRIQLI